MGGDMTRTSISLHKLLLVAFLIVILTLVYLPAAGADALALAQSCGQWSITRSSDPSTMLSLDGIAAISPQDVWTVGYFINLQGTNQALTERWNGNRWINVPNPDPGTPRSFLDGVAGDSPTDVWAVGGTAAGNWENQHTLIEHLNGTDWSLFPSMPGVLDGVAILSANNVWAVGGNAGKTLVEQWNGSQWNVIPSPSPGKYGNSLNSVTALTPSDVWAVGSYSATQFGYRSLIEHWNGSRWSVVKSPVLGTYPYDLRAVSGIAANDIWAVGDYTTPPGDITLTLAEHWNGKQWSVVPTPSPTGDDILLGVAAIATNDVWAVGDYSPGGQNLIEQWNGTGWNVVSSPFRRSGVSGLSAVSADSATDIWAAGIDINKHNFTYHTLIEHYC